MNTKDKFPDCSKDCEAVKMLGVGECESVCPDKFKKFTLKSSQYISRRPESLPSGMPKCRTYYYFENNKGQVVDFKTLKPYRGKQMHRFAMHSKVEAEAYLEVINFLAELDQYIEHLLKR